VASSYDVKPSLYLPTAGQVVGREDGRTGGREDGPESGRTWDRTRDLSRVKRRQALRLAAARCVQAMAKALGGGLVALYFARRLTSC